MTKNKELPRLGDFLRNARETAGLTQKQVATHLKYGSAQFVSEWERGVRSPPGAVLRKLVELYKIPLNLFYDVIMEEQIKAIELSLKKDLFG
jgi:transcriptional regulator with XRE-family HTH domain